VRPISSLLFSAALTLALAALSAPVRAQQEPDTSFDTRIAHPAFTSSHPRVMIDEAHHEFHTMSGRYRPFADLIRHDGCQVVPGRAAFTASDLKGVDVLVISNALGVDDMSDPAAAHPAFMPAECAAVRDWVRAGGALLLIADHAPMGSAARALGDTLGVDMRSAYTIDPLQSGGRNASIITYTAGHGLATDHPIVRGRDSTERVRTVVAFTGQSLTGPPGATLLMRLSDQAQDLMVGYGQAGRDVPPDKRSPAGGRAQGLAFTLGKGRVVVLGEAAMMTAQVAGPARFKMGMNSPGNDDRQFAINVVRWLARALE
jgi:hypothetical protein